MTDHKEVLEVNGTARNEEDWSCICPHCDKDLDFTGYFDEDDIHTCPRCKGKFKVVRCYFSDERYMGKMTESDIKYRLHKELEHQEKVKKDMEIKAKDSLISWAKDKIKGMAMVDQELAEITEKLGEAVHIAWMDKRKKEKGWHHPNECPNCENKYISEPGIPPTPNCSTCHPCMVPYKDLPDSEKELDRAYPRTFIKILGEMGYEIVQQAKVQPEPKTDLDIKGFEGYKQAQVFDEQLAKLYIKYPPNDENRLQWLNFTRTITTDLDIISKDCMKKKQDDSPKCPNCGAKVVHVAEHYLYAEYNMGNDGYTCEKVGK